MFRYWLVLFLCTSVQLGRAESWDLSINPSLESAVFPVQPASSSQQAFDISPALKPRFSLQWENRRQTFEAALFGRYDSADTRRTHFDISEFSYVKAWDSFELRAGVRKVFWGVTESQHLVDIINQTDQVEDFTFNAKLGQPMVSGAAITDIGTFELFLMPFFRERTYPGLAGHFRQPYVVNVNKVTYESPNGPWNPDLAFRWSDHLGVFDIGLSHFYGTNRQPQLIQATSSTGGIELDPYYYLVQQTGLDVQMSTGGFLGKLEAITRGNKNYGNAYFAATGGGEYTFSQLFGSLDVGLLCEYMYDSRGESAPTAFENDLFFGIRLTPNDSKGFDFLVGSIWDLNTNNEFFELETSRRFGDDWKLTLKGALFNVTTTSDPLFSYARDSYIKLELSNYSLKWLG